MKKVLILGATGLVGRNLVKICCASESIDVVKILAWTIPFMFLHIPGATILMSTNKFLKTIIYLSILTLGFNVFLNFLLIPQYGFIGASCSLLRTSKSGGFLCKYSFAASSAG